MSRANGPSRLSFSTRVNYAIIRHKKETHFGESFKASTKGKCRRELRSILNNFIIPKIDLLTILYKIPCHGTHVLSHKYCTRTKHHSQEGNGQVRRSGLLREEKSL